MITPGHRQFPRSRRPQLHEPPSRRLLTARVDVAAKKRRPSRQPRPRPSPPPAGGVCCEPAVVLCGPTREHRGSAGHQVDHTYRGRGSCVCGWKAERETKRSRLHPPRQDDSFVSRSAFPAQGLLTIRCEVREPLLRLQDGTKPSSTTPTTRL